jgi:hypothetical protein
MQKVTLFNKVINVNTYNSFSSSTRIQIPHEKALFLTSLVLLSYVYFLLYKISGNELAMYQELSLSILQVKTHDLNNREIYQFLQFTYLKNIQFSKNRT